MQGNFQKQKRLKNPNLIVGLSQENLVLDLLAALHLDNQLYQMSKNSQDCNLEQAKD